MVWPWPWNTKIMGPTASPYPKTYRCRAITWFYIRTSHWDMAYFHLLVADNDLWHWSRVWPWPWMTKIMPPTHSPYPKTHVQSHYLFSYDDWLLRYGAFSFYALFLPQKQCSGTITDYNRKKRDTQWTPNTILNYSYHVWQVWYFYFYYN